MKVKIIATYTLLIFTIFGLQSCSHIKDEAKIMASENLRKYTKEGIEKLLSTGVKIGLPSDVEKILPLLKQFGLKTSSKNLSEEITKLSDKAVKTAEPILFMAIDEMSLKDAIDLMTTSRRNAPLTKYLQSKTEGLIVSMLQTEIEKGLKKIDNTKMLMDAMTAYSIVSGLSGKKDFTNISEYSATIITKEIFKYIASAEKADNPRLLRIGE